jgi:hypothetical protein
MFLKNGDKFQETYAESIGIGPRDIGHYDVTNDSYIEFWDPYIPYFMSDENKTGVLVPEEFSCDKFDGKSACSYFEMLACGNDRKGCPPSVKISAKLFYIGTGRSLILCAFKKNNADYPVKVIDD